MDSILFSTVSMATAAWKKQRLNAALNDDVFTVDKDNKPLAPKHSTVNGLPWYRATFILIMYEPPHLFYEPKEWSETTVLLLQRNDEDHNKIWTLPGGPVPFNTTYEASAIQHLQKHHKIDVCAPQNCLHHLFTFPLGFEAPRNGYAGVWGDFYECVARGPMPEFEVHHNPLSSFSLAELRRMVDGIDGGSNRPQDGHTMTTSKFTTETLYALKLYFQRQGDLRAKRRLLKGYSSTELEKYGLRHSSSSGSSLEKLVLTDLKDTQRQRAIDYTMKCDDGMSPSLLHMADVVLLGVSRAGKTPMSIYMAQTMGLKVANIPLVMELPPPVQLQKVNPRKVFCLTLQPDYLVDFRRNRFQREMSRNTKRSGYGSLGLGLGGGSSNSIGSASSCSYADSSYVQRDLDNARSLARTHGYTEIDVTGRAMEETSSLILSKLQERFPDQACYHGI